MPPDKIQAGPYLYCIIRCTGSPPSFKTRGIGERGDVVYTIHHRDLAAVVSDSPVIEYEQTRRNMMAHTVVLEEVMQIAPVLPVRFGTIAPSPEAIQQQLLQTRYQELDELLCEVDGRVELGLKAFWHEESIFSEVVAENPAIQRLRDSLLSRRPEETYYDRIRLGEMIEAAMEGKRAEDADKILGRLRSLAYKTRLAKPFTDYMVVNAAFLVDCRREPELDQAVQQLDEEMNQRFVFKYVGPVPPYNFVNLPIRWA